MLCLSSSPTISVLSQYAMESPRRYGVLTLCLFENELGTQRRIIGVALFGPSIKSRFVRRVE